MAKDSICQDKTVSNDTKPEETVMTERDKKWEKSIKRTEAIWELINKHDGVNAVDSFSQGTIQLGYNIASEMVDGNDIYEMLLGNLQMAENTLEYYIACMKKLASSLDTFKEYLVKINPDYEKEFLISGELGGIASIVESKALCCEEALDSVNW